MKFFFVLSSCLRVFVVYLNRALNAMRLISAKLSRLRRRERTIALTWGVARLALVAFIALAVACYADWRIDMRRDTPMALRVGMLAVQIALVVALGWWWVVRPLVRSRTDDDVALFIEEETPALGHVLISAVQLNRPSADTAGMSPELIGVVTQEAEERARAIDVRELTDERLLWKAGGIVTLVALFAGSAWFAAPKTVSVLLVRQTLGEGEIPRGLHLANWTSEIWPAGEPVRLRLFAYGRYDPNTDLSIEIQFDEERKRVFPATQTSKIWELHTFTARYEAEISADCGELSFNAWLGDARLKVPGWIRRVPRPAVIKQDAWTILPAHCGTKPDGQRYHVEQPRGEIFGLPGSGALVRCKSQKPIVKGRVELLGTPARNEEGKALVEVKRAIDMEVKSDEATCQFDLHPDESAYRIVVVDEYGFENADPPRRGIKIVPEEPPTVALLPEQFLPEQFPGAGIAEDFEVEGVPIPLGGAIRIAYTATHPYGLGKATLQFRVNDGAWQPFPLGEAVETEKTGPFDLRRGAFVNSKPSDQVQFHAVPSRDPERLLPRTDGGGRFDFQTRGLPDLKIGDRVEFFVEVANRDLNSPQIGRSETRVKTIVTVPQLVQWIDATLRQEDRIRQLEQKQKNVFDHK
jgi:hypothetical protein